MKEKYIDRIWKKLMEVGSFMGCHQRADRSFHIGKYQCPLCARCTGVVSGTIFVYFNFKRVRVNKCMPILLILPMAADGIVQYFTKYESNNIRRVNTGFFAGIGLTIIRLKIYNNIFGKILKCIRTIIQLLRVIK